MSGKTAIQKTSRRKVKFKKERGGGRWEFFQLTGKIVKVKKMAAKVQLKFRIFNEIAVRVNRMLLNLRQWRQK